MRLRSVLSAIVFCASVVAALAPPIEARAADTAPLMDQPDRGGREIRRDVDVVIAPARAYAMWASAEGLRSWLVSDASVDLRIGGVYEPLFAPASAGAGNRGNEGGRVLAYVPNEMLAVTWNAPPTVPELRGQGARTYVVVRFAARPGGGTHVSLVQRNIGAGAAWDAYATYFEDAWTGVMGAFADKAR
jgi:uncharacterized protein YndB with AHSA1/START domain